MFNWTYDEEKLKQDASANNGRAYQRCAKTVMDTINDPDIVFDEQGVCNYWHSYQELMATGNYSGEKAKNNLDALIQEIKSSEFGEGKYNCIIGLSGGVDSSYLVYLAKKWGIRPLIVHFDYGWNLELAVHNIHSLIKWSGFDLYTHVIDWPEFRKLQRAYIKAGVLDLDVPADHLIFGSLNQVAKRLGIRNIINGVNHSTEFILPDSWKYDRKNDVSNLKDIYSQFGEQPLKNLPTQGFWKNFYFRKFHKLKSFTPLVYMPYDDSTIKKTLETEVGWVRYGGKHFENIFTRFYQGYILPTRFGIDKRKAHLSSMICSGQINREKALKELAEPPYTLDLMRQDYEYVHKKLGFSEREFDDCLKGPIRHHRDFNEQRRLETFMVDMKQKVLGKG